LNARKNVEEKFEVRRRDIGENRQSFNLLNARKNVEEKFEVRRRVSLSHLTNYKFST
jgi:hypothetical protein